MIPEEIAERLLIQFCNTHTILIGRSVFRCDVHRQLGEIKVGADAGRGRDACRIQHFPDHRHGKVAGTHLVVGEVGGCVDEYLVDGIDQNILRRNVFLIDAVNLPGYLQ